MRQRNRKIGETHGVADYCRECLRQACAARRSGANPVKAGSGDSGGPSFGKMVTDAIGSVVESGRKSDGLAQGMAAARPISSMW